MADPKSFNDIVFEIPAGASPAVKMHLRAQMTIQAAFYAFGTESNKSGSFTLGRSEISDVLALALAMLLATDRRVRTNNDIQQASEETANRIAGFTEALQGDHSIEQMFAMLGMSSTEAN